MIFANPWVLMFLILIPVMALLYFFRASQSDLSISLTEHPKSYSSFLDKLGYHLPFFLRLITLVLIIIMLARPQLGQSFTVSKHQGLDIVLAVDTSQSMSALDLRLNGQVVDRLTVLKTILKDFVLQRPNDRLALLVFGEKAYTQCPLTLDHGAIIDLIGNMEIGMVGGSTAIGDAIAIAVKRLKDLQAKSRVLILMTDGQNTAGSISPLIATEMAQQLGVKIYTIGIGQDGEVPFQVDTPMGPMLIQQAIPIDEESLVKIAGQTGGQYFRAQTSADLVKIYDYINKLEKTEMEVKQYSSYKDIYESFLWIAFAAFFGEILLANTILFRII